MMMNIEHSSFIVAMVEGITPYIILVDTQMNDRHGTNS